MKNTQKKIIVSLFLIVMSVAIIAGVTYAWFTDTASNTGNRIQAGNLKIDLLMDQTLDNSDPSDYVSIKNGTGDIFKDATKALNSNETLWEPGKTQVVFLAVENQGNLALKYTAFIDVTDEGLASSLEYALFDEGTYKSLQQSGKTSWTELKAIATASGDVTDGRVTIATGLLDEIAHEPSIENERDYVALAVHMKESAGNDYKDKNVTIDVSIEATQATAEKDGFDNDQYDANAEIIDTSEFCTNHHTHEIFTSLGTDGVESDDDTYRDYYYDNGKWYYSEHNDDKPLAMSLNVYYDMNDLVVCTKNHNPSNATLVCPHMTYHIYVSEYNPNGNEVYSWYVYDNVTNQLFCYGEYNRDIDSLLKENPGKGWFYSDDDINYYPCEEDCHHSVITYSELDHDDYYHYVDMSGIIYNIYKNGNNIWVQGSNVGIDDYDDLEPSGQTEDLTDQNRPAGATGYWKNVYIKIGGWYYPCAEKHYGSWT